MSKRRWSVVDVEVEELVGLAVEEEDNELEEQDEGPASYFHCAGG